MAKTPSFSKTTRTRRTNLDANLLDMIRGHNELYRRCCQLIDELVSGCLTRN